MTWDHPLLLWAVPAAALMVAAFELRVPGSAARRVGRFLARTAVLACAIAALAAPSVSRHVPQPRRVVIAVDYATRTPLAASAREAGHALRETLRDVAAAKGLAVEVMPFTTRPGSADAPPPPTARSALGAGLAGARLRFREGETGGVIVITDGHGDLGGARAAVDALRADAIATTGIAIPDSLPARAASARIEALDAPDQAHGVFAVRARVHLPAPAPHRVVLRVDGVETEALERAADAPASVVFKELDLPVGLHELSVTLERGGEAQALARRLVAVAAPPRVLALVRGAAWIKALEVQGLAIVRGDPAGLRSILASGRIPDAVVADAESLVALPADAAHVLRARVHDGLGLVIVAGADTAAWAALAKGPLAGLLPLVPQPEPPKPPPPRPEPKDEPPPPPIEKPEEAEGPGLKAERRPEEALPITLLLLIDRSGSMAVPIAKLEMAILGAQRAAEALSPWDRVGVISFASDVRLDVPVRSARTASTLAAWLTGVEPDIRPGTDIAGALRLARQVMEKERTPIKHIILLTDGRQYPSGPIFGPVVKPMGRMGITITAVGIGRGANLSQLREIVQWAARGHIRPARSPSEIPRILTRDTEQVAEKRRVDAEAIDARLHDDRKKAEAAPPKDEPKPPPPPVAPPRSDPEPDPEPVQPVAPLPLVAVRAHEALRGFAAADLPAVGAPRRALARPTAALLLTRSDATPVLAASREGLGRVLMWALPPSDPGALAWAPLGRLFAQTTRSALAPEGAFEFLPTPRVRETPDGASLQVLWPPGASSGHVDARWIGPAGSSQPIGTFTPDDGEAGRPLPPAAPGSRCRIELTLPGGPTPPPLTYLAARPATTAEEAADARALATALGAALEDPLTFVRGLPQLSRRERRARWPLFLWLAILLLPLDVFLHRRAHAA